MIDRQLVTGAVLAGGHSSRFGSNKALYASDGQTIWLVQGVQLLQSICQRVLVSASKETAESYINYVREKDIVIDVTADQGPLGGITSLLRNCSTPWLLILPCDMPFITEDILSQMLKQASEDIDAISWSNEEGRMSFPLLLHQRTAETIDQMLRNGNRRMKMLLEDIHTIYLPINTPEAFRNINKNSDL